MPRTIAVAISLGTILVWMWSWWPPPCAAAWATTFAASRILEITMTISILFFFFVVVVFLQQINNQKRLQLRPLPLPSLLPWAHFEMPTTNRWGPVSRDHIPQYRMSFGPILWSDDVPSSWGAGCLCRVFSLNRILFPYHLACEESAVECARASETNTPESERILCAMADKSDPRMPSAARPYVPALVDPNDLPPDYSSILAIIFGIAGVMMRVRFSCFSFAFWNPIFLCFFLVGFFWCLGWQQSVGSRIFDSRALFVISWVGATFFLRWSVFISSSSFCFCSDLGLGFLGFGGGRDIGSLQVASSRHLWVNSIFLGNRGPVHFLRFLILENADAF